MRVRGRVQHITGWTGGLLEEAEPDLAAGAQLGRLRSGENFAHGETARLVVRGGARVALTLAEQSISDLVAIAPWSRTGAILIAHSATEEEHYAYALSERGALALPVGTPTEIGSRVSIDWDVALPVAAQAVELFETLFVADTSFSGRQALVALELSSGSLVATTVEADLDEDATAGAMRPGGLAVFQSVLFAWGWEDETFGEAPHVLRHSLLGQNPKAAAGWGADGAAIIGAIGEPIRAAVPGDASLLVAKPQSLFRIYGEPDAAPEWQFGIQQLDATIGFGCVNAQSLKFGANRWWGIGADGPWSSAGDTPQRLVSSRRKSMAQVGDLSASFVAHHPRRNAMVFGFEEPTALVSGSRASRLWLYDLARDQWAPDYRFPARFWLAASVQQQGVVLSDSPTAVTWVTGAAVETHAITLSWTIADPEAQTEVWLQPVDGVETQVATTVPGATGIRIAGLTSGTAYAARVRHRVGATLAEFTEPVTCATQLFAPRFKQTSLALPSGGAARLDVGVVMPCIGQTVVLAPIAGGTTPGADAQVFENLPRAETTLAWQTPNYANVGSWSWVMASEQPSLPADARVSPPMLWAAGRASGAPSGAQYSLVQRLDETAWAETSISLVVESFQSGAYTVQLRPQVVGAAWFTVGALNPALNGSVVELTVPNLEHSRRYEARVTYAINSVPLQAVVIPACTKLRAPTGSVAVTGSPAVTLSIAPPEGRTGMDIEVQNSTGAFDALYGSVSGVSTDYESTVGICGRPDVYYARLRNTAWPEGLQYSDPLILPVANPCV